MALSLSHLPRPARKSTDNEYQSLAIRKRFDFLKKMSAELRMHRMERSENDQTASEDEVTFIEASTRPETSEVSMSPETPVVARFRRRESAPTTRGSNERRDRARSNTPNIRRPVSQHPSRR
ncbi:uncharacterized protein KD926_010896 [Aspergillus affinis]|uniref:uncharacterized protein n=1 Tax=Aspergillus affinis TaxID=1070780 RepID=UPI0022FE0186|nr:uncharacterized protein KD926_010896 [Aspergillus affinis]KAI9038360.1 hypothetical protein KD926_010896 [Aspergillus affinis]